MKSSPRPHDLQSSPTRAAKSPGNHRKGKHANLLFWAAMRSLGGLYLLLILSMVLADLQFASWEDVQRSLADPRVRFSLSLSLISCTISAILATWVAVPTGYVLSRGVVRPSGLTSGAIRARAATVRRIAIELLFDIPIVLPPLVVGISLLILFQTTPGRWLDDQTGYLGRWLGFPSMRGITYEIPAVILAQFTVATAFAIRIMRATFEQMDPEPEQTALVLGASEGQAFSYIALPQAWRGIVNAFTIAWARSLGEFGPILIFAGTTRMKTEVLSTTVYLNFTNGNLRGALAASLLMIVLATVVLLATRLVTLSSFDNEDMR